MQRWKKEAEDKRRGPKRHARALSNEERQLVLDTACTEEFCDFTPPRIVARLADQGKYIASEATFYRVLRGENALAHRSRARAPERHEPVFTVATHPNTVWVWDITNLRSYTPGFFFKLYLFEDLFSRKVVGWDVLETQNDGDANEVLRKALKAEGINGKDLRLHSDNGTPMRGAHMLYTMLGLGIRPSFSRPSVSNDNPHVESYFRTMKYSPAYPTKPFRDLNAARKWVGDFVAWYNDSMHSRLSYVTPNQRHRGESEEVLKQRREVYLNACRIKPVRWVNKPRTWPQPALAQLNPHGTRLVKATTL